MDFVIALAKEWGTFLLATYGAGMSTIMALRDYRRNRPRLEVRMQGPKLSIRNCGSAPVYLGRVGYIADDWAFTPIPYRQLSPIEPLPNGRLDRWQEVLLLTDLRTDIVSAMKIPKAWWASDQSGAIFTSYPALHPMGIAAWWKKPR